MKYYYKIVDGKVGKLLNESQLAIKELTQADMIADNRQIAENENAMYKVFADCGQADRAGIYGILKSIPVEPTASEIALSKTIFTKLQIRRAMRALGNEAILDGLLTNEAFKKDWADAVEIDLSDPLTAQALASVQVDINAVKLAIAGILPNVE
jgi:hypothetical protein